MEKEHLEEGKGDCGGVRSTVSYRAASRSHSGDIWGNTLEGDKWGSPNAHGRGGPGVALVCSGSGKVASVAGTDETEN